ncbi:MAG: HAD-IA family hydrolase [Actinomycetia bacterium]|nr:HAD-IA family hydrolase [Actinomycetes bacterium]
MTAARATDDRGAAGGVLDRTFAAILFDLDGTLIDSTAAVKRCWLRWTTEFGVPLPEVIEHGLASRTNAARYLPAADVEAAAKRWEELEVIDTDGVVAAPGARAMFDALPPNRAAIVTSCTIALARARIAAAGLIAPPVTVTVDQLRRGKPDPEGCLRAASLLGVDPRDCVVVEDAPAGLAAGTAAGCMTIALTTTTDRTELSADLIVDTLADLRVTIEPSGIRLRRAP